MRKKTYLKLVDYQTEQSEKHLNEVRSIHKEMRGYKQVNLRLEKLSVRLLISSNLTRN